MGKTNNGLLSQLSTYCSQLGSGQYIQKRFISYINSCTIFSFLLLQQLKSLKAHY